ncbi:MAG TPA: alginate export family protein, partial [Planctomycetota bacterium]|nr:alginate export family protein [Planctomycetota bacterium]
KGFWIDAFYSNVVVIEPTNQKENWEWKFNSSNEDDHFAGLYGQSSYFSVQTTEAFVLYREKDGNAPLYSSTTTTPAFGPAPAYDVDQEVWTLGMRIKSTPGMLAGFDYDFEGAYQVGTVKPSPASRTLDHEAFALHAGAGYTFEEVWSKPRVGIEYNLASGDKDFGDGTNESFMNLFPTNHKFYGYMDVFAWKNLHNPAVQLKCTPWQDSLQPYRLLFVQLDYHLFWLYTNEDAWYRANGVTAVRPLNAAARSADRFAGSEIDLTIGYNPTKWLKLLGGYSHFFAGDYLKDTGRSDDADFVYVQSILQF